jgi:hypothetical protein
MSRPASGVPAGAGLLQPEGTSPRDRGDTCRPSIRPSALPNSSAVSPNVGPSQHPGDRSSIARVRRLLQERARVRYHACEIHST